MELQGKEIKSNESRISRLKVEYTKSKLVGLEVENMRWSKFKLTKYLEIKAFDTKE